MFKDYYEKLLKQLAIDFNSTPQALKSGENIITVSKFNEDRRKYAPGVPFLEMGHVPFYGTAAANVHSQSIAINCGFRPTWVEANAMKIEE